MRRFVRTLFARKRARIEIIQDGGSRQIEVWLWEASASGSPTIVTVREYTEDRQTIGPARSDAISAGVRLARELTARDVAESSSRRATA